MQLLSFRIWPVFFLILLTTAAFSQNTVIPEVIIQCTPESPFAGSELTLTLLVEYPNPHEVTILSPSFPESFFLDRSLKSARFMPETDTENMWTQAEYHIKTDSPGTYTIDPFIIITPGGSVWTESITLTVRDALITNAVLRPLLVWDGVPPELHTGQSASVSLLMRGWDSGFPLPGPFIFMPPLSEGLILEMEEPADSAGAAACVLRLRLTPLGAGPLYLPARSVIYNSINFEIPSLNIKVMPSVMQVPENTGEIEETRLLPFPEFDFPFSAGFFSRLFFRAALFVDDYESVYRTSENFYNHGYYAEALALLRQNEREHAAFPLFASLRQQTEQNLGLFHARNEKPRRLIVNCYLVFLALVLAVFMVLFLRKKSLKSRLILSAVFIAAAAVSLIYSLSGTRAAGLSHAGSYRQAVLKETELRQIPDFSATQYTQIYAGLPVRVFKAKGKRNAENLLPCEVSWVWIISYDIEKLSGWVPEDMVVYY